MISTALQTPEPCAQRARGHVRVVSKVGQNGATGLDVLRQSGSLKMVFPKSHHGRLDGVIVNTAGGLTGGDRFDVSIHATADCSVAVTTQAAERIYRRVGDSVARIETKLIVDNDAQLSWLPQETILFDGSCLSRSLDVEVADRARFLFVEPVVFGRELSGEHVTNCTFRDSVRVSSQGLPMYLDRVHLTGNLGSQLVRSAVGAGARAMASLVLVARDVGQYLAAVRSLLPVTGGASVIRDNVLVVRLLCTDGYALRTSVLPILKLLTDDAVPKNWRL